MEYGIRNSGPVFQSMIKLIKDFSNFVLACVAYSEVSFITYYYSFLSFLFVQHFKLERQRKSPVSFSFCNIPTGYPAASNNRAKFCNFSTQTFFALSFALDFKRRRIFAEYFRPRKINGRKASAFAGQLGFGMQWNLKRTFKSAVQIKCLCRMWLETLVSFVKILDYV